jgi:hypothetical protein
VRVEGEVDERMDAKEDSEVISVRDAIVLAVSGGCAQVGERCYASFSEV